jgi:hypothetical protein
MHKIKKKDEDFTIEQAAIIIAGEIRNMCRNDAVMINKLVMEIDARIPKSVLINV